MDRTDMDLRIFVLHRTGARFGVQSVRVGRIPDKLQFRLPIGRRPRQEVYPGILYGGMVHTIHNNIVLLRKHTNGGVDDHRNSHQQGWPTRREEENRYTIGVHGDRGSGAVVCVVDAIRRCGTAGCIRPEGVHLAVKLDDPGFVLQSC